MFLLCLVYFLYRLLVYSASSTKRLPIHPSRNFIAEISNNFWWSLAICYLRHLSVVRNFSRLPLLYFSPFHISLTSSIAWSTSEKVHQQLIDLIHWLQSLILAIFEDFPLIIWLKPALVMDHVIWCVLHPRAQQGQ